MKLKILLSLIVTALLFSCNPFKNNEINKVINAFYVKHKGPFEDVDKKLLSASLSALVDKAIAEEVKSAKELKAIRSTDKPAMIEGDIFTSLSESFTSYEIGKTKINDNRAAVMVEFTNNKLGLETWKDEIELIKENGEWKIDNVRYKGERAVGKSTKDVLAQFLTPITLVRTDADDQRCRLSAGSQYQWSNIKKGCIRVFELPFKLRSMDRTSIASVIFSDDQKKAEVFTQKTSWVLNKKSLTAYETEAVEGGVFLEKRNNVWRLGELKDGKTIYSGNME
ncbi:hypothetical protein HDF26_004446 [Pedobacter cryoconitis]|uniref:DUF3828 domain-containing protein n=1 Tax=Pedobacter cryoconitis TaxID=188932 RepID=A0A7W8ZNP5_9SPHI|nr:DUF3828 domain-containing protein [Pedobacter cryoconitis]MBB5637213.1 hypothetical protein [Pedobacter cryoconitis]MBB6273973.1 hypothetical protein [Pedobacter cryoconitis]